MTLEQQVEGILEWLAGRSPIPAYKGQRILEVSDPRVRWEAGDPPGWRLPADALHCVEDFAPRFDVLLRQGYSWINLSVYGLYRQDLVFGIELPSDSGLVPAGQTRVNYSGPPFYPGTAEPNWQLDLFLITTSTG